jgi:hypothetical protein
MILVLKLSFVFLLGAFVALLGDACHVASGTTTYATSAWPLIWRSPAWFPLLVGSSVAVVAYIGLRLGLPGRSRTRIHAGVAVPSVLALHALTALLRAQAPTVSVVFVGSLALIVWCAWDPSFGCLPVRRRLQSSVGCCTLATLFVLRTRRGGLRTTASAHASAAMTTTIVPWSGG